jgi:hypothetical protein
VHSINAFLVFVVDVAWNPIVLAEFVTSCSDGSVQVWRISVDESGSVVSQMVWGPNLGLLYTMGASFTNAVGVGLIYQKLLVQREALFSLDESTSCLTRESLLSMPYLLNLIFASYAVGPMRMR